MSTSKPSIYLKYKSMDILVEKIELDFPYEIYWQLDHSNLYIKENN